jgi:hypothetical protein
MAWSLPLCVMVGSPTGENMEPLSLSGARYTASLPAAEHSAYGLHLNNVIAKRLGISASD